MQSEGWDKENRMRQEEESFRPINDVLHYQYRR